MKVGTDGVLLGAWADIPEQGRTLDIGTGTGVLALIAAQRSNSSVTAIEPDDASFKQSSENFAASEWNNRIVVINTSLQDFAGKQPEKFDFIISNPPFHEESVFSPDNRINTAKHSESLPLKDLIECIAALLKSDGLSAIIYPYRHLNRIIEILTEKKLFILKITRVRPVPEKYFHRVLIQFGFCEKPLIESEITIETGERHHYSSEYKSLTEPYYLYFLY
jgi:tRNA1Val (adenine37-N6)-methyltransferase